MNIYKKNTADYYKNKIDMHFVNCNNYYSYEGIIDWTMNFLENFQLLDTEQWNRFVNQFKQNSDFDFGWRGEFWGKMMRGACFVYTYSKNEKLYNVLKNTVIAMMETANEEGRISSYGVEIEFQGWDIWCRKYVLLGLQYFLEICPEEELKQRIIESMCSQVDYIMSKIGKTEEGKIHITTATRHWRGLNSASLLEPIVRLYCITDEKKYFDFAQYIVDAGGTDVVNIFDLAYEDKFYPYQYPVTKAYEMISCFEGLLEFYRVTQNEKYKVSIINFANKILESDFTVIGCSGCSHELFDHSTVRQANTNNGATMQETCVTVTLMKFFYQLHVMTGESKYVDAFEQSLYNAYLGAVNTEKVENIRVLNDHPDCHLQALPFDSYSPLTAGKRGKDIGGFRMMSDEHYYGCCACIGSAGVGLVPKMHILNTDDGFVLNMLIPGTVKTNTINGDDIVFKTNTQYPKCGNAEISIEIDKKTTFVLKIRNPKWSKTTKVMVNGENINATEGYIVIEREWCAGDKIEIELDMRTEAIYPIPYGTQILMNKFVGGKNYVIPTFDEEDVLAKNHIALRRGPIMLAQDSRFGYDLSEPIDIMVNTDGYVDVQAVDSSVYKSIVEVKIPLKNGDFINVTDYASAGKLWEEDSAIAVWMLTL